MDEREWLVYVDPEPMLDFLFDSHRDEMNGRKRWLCAVAPCRRVWHRLGAAGRRVVEVTERFADDLVSLLEVQAAHRHVEPAIQAAWDANDSAAGFARLAAFNAVDDEPPIGTMGAYAFAALSEHFSHIRHESNDDSELAAAAQAEATEKAVQANLLRDVFGNPFRPVTVDPAWLTPNVSVLAGTIYDERAFNRVPFLADALEEAGCDNADILSHCRGPGPHVRGCWVLDLVTGRA